MLSANKYLLIILITPAVFLLLYIFQNFFFRFPETVSAAFSNEETVTAAATSTSQISTGTVGSGSDQLYLVAVSNFQDKPVSWVSGLGLNFKRQISQCAGRNTTGIEIWTAFGTGTPGPVTVGFSSQTSAAVVFVSRFSGADPANPVENPQGANTNGSGGICSGGIDSSSAILSLTSNRNNAILYTTTTTRTKTISFADPDYILMGKNTAGSSGGTTTLYIHNRTLQSTGTDQINHSLSGSTDWAAAGIIINPAALITPAVSLTPTSVILPTATATPTAVILPTATTTPTSVTSTPSPASQTYYISPSGNDSNQGTSPDSPWKTIAKVNTGSYSSGDRILFEGSGLFPGNLKFTASSKGTATNPIRIGSYGTGRAQINAGNATGISIVNTSGFLIENISVAGSGRTVNTGFGISFYTDASSGVKLPYVHIDSVDVSGFGDTGISIGSWNGTSGYSDVRISHSSVYNNGRAGIGIYGQSRYAHTNVYIGHVQAYNNPGQASSTTNSGNGIVIGQTDGATIERSVAHGNGWIGTGSVGIWAYDSKNITIQYNESYDNRTGGSADGGGFDLDGGITNSVMQYNYSHGNDGAGFGLYQYPGASTWSDNTVRYNISQNDGRKNSYAGIQVWNGGSGLSKADIYNNVIYISPSSSGSPSGVKFSGSSTDFHFRNNIFITSGGLSLLNVPSGQSGILFQGNDYYSGSGNWTVKWSGSNFSGLTAWRSASGQEKVGSSATGFSLDPKLFNAGGGGIIGDADQLNNLTAYQLQTASPMINAALNLSSLFGINPGPNDFYGNAIPSGGTYDIGAYESSMGPTFNPTPTPLPVSNLLINPGFEADANGDGRPDTWSSNSNFTRSDALVHSGNYSGRHGSTSDSSYTVSQTVTGISAGKNYNFAGWVNIPPTTDSFTFKLQVQWRDSSNNTISTKTVKSYSSATSGWDYANSTITAPSGSVTAQIRTSVSSLKAVIYTDDLSLL